MAKLTKKKVSKKVARKRPRVRGNFDRERLTTKDFGPSLTRQEFKEDCDINTIVAQFVKTGVVTHINRREAQYGYVDGADFSDAMRIVTQAQAMFGELPSEVRKRFNNDPAALLDFVQDPDNAAEMAQMGLTGEPRDDLPPPEPPPDPEPAPAPKTPPEGSQDG